jgi:protein TonB
VAAAAPEAKPVHAPVHEVTAEPKPLPVTAGVRHDEPASMASVPTPAKVAVAAHAAVADAAPPPAASPATSPPGKPAMPVVASAPQGAVATPPPPPHAVDPAPVPVPAKPATSPSRPIAGEPTKLAMAASSAADAHPPAKVKLLPVARQDPEFPREAIVRGVTSGDVKARLSIDGTGKVTAVDIVEARPARVFDRVVKDALSHWSFPAGASGRSTEVEIAFHRD